MFPNRGHINATKVKGAKGAVRLKDHIFRRVLEVSQYIARTQATVRDAARTFGVSKSTVHKDVTERLPRLDAQLASTVRQVLELNKAERHIRGGEATRVKYLRDDADIPTPLSGLG